MYGSHRRANPKYIDFNKYMWLYDYHHHCRHRGRRRRRRRHRRHCYHHHHRHRHHRRRHRRHRRRRRHHHCRRTPATVRVNCDSLAGCTCASSFPLAYLSGRNRCTTPAPRNHRSSCFHVHHPGRSRSTGTAAPPTICHHRSSSPWMVLRVWVARPWSLRFPRAAAKRRRYRLAKMPSGDDLPWSVGW